MALCGVGLSPSFESLEVACVGGNLSTRRIRPSLMRAIGKSSDWKRRPCLGVRCSSLKLDGNAQTDISVPVEEESGHVIKFKMSDFKVLDCVSVGLGGRAGEVVFEAIVKDTNSPLYNTQVVLRRLTSVRAQRRGKRAIEVLKKLARRRLMYHSYSMQVHGYISSAISSGRSSFTLVHGYHGSFSLRHWLQQSDWLPTLEATLALDKESVRRVGDDTVGGSAVSRQLRMIRILMRDLLIGVNYLHSHGLAHTELRLENVHISPVDRHIKVGILGNAADFYDDSPNCGTADNNMDRRQMMIAFDMRCLGFMMAKMVLRELMDPLIFTKFKSFLTKGNDPSCLREFLLQILHRNSSSGNAGLQILDRNWGAGWNLLSLLLATEPSKRVSCLDALTHPFLCGPRWRVVPSIDIIRWGLGSTALRISEEYIYGQPQRSRLSHFIELMEMLNPNSRPKNWLELLPGKWRLLYCTGRHIGLTFRQPPEQVLIGHVHLTVSRVSKLNTSLLFASDTGFTVMIGQDWPHDKAGVDGKLQVNSLFRLMAGRRLYLKEEEKNTEKLSNPSNTRDAFAKLSGRKWRKALPFKESPSSLPVAKLVSSGIDEVTMNLGDPLSKSINSATNVVQEVRTQVPPEMFDLSKLVCGTYVDSRLLVIRGPVCLYAVNFSKPLKLEESESKSKRQRSVNLSKMWAKLNQSMLEGNEEGGEGFLDEESDGFCALSATQRMYGFAACLLAGLVCMFLSLIVFAKPIKFAVLFTFGNLLAVGSTAFLFGPGQQMRMMFDSVRVYATAIYLGCVVIALICALWIHSKILTIIAIICEVCALIWYSLSYIPFARRIVSNLMIRLFDTEL